MLNRQTVLVLGAGASVEVGLPTGAELTNQIAKMLDMKWELNQQVSGDRLIAQALIERSRARSGDNSWNITDEVHAGRRIASAMAEALSIDNYMEAHSDEIGVMAVGKLAIARAISEAERKSKLWLDLRTGEDFSAVRTKDTWYHSFWQLLHQGVTLANVHRLFENLTIISFNYDRCLQQRLFFGLKNYYNLCDATALEALKHLNIQYPYGSLGTYSGPTSFGSNYDAKQLLQVSSGIKTFSERVDDAGCLDSIHGAIAGAERIIFLGFAFHPQNMALMTTPQNSIVKRMYATAYGIPQSNLEPIRNQLVSLVGRNDSQVVDFSTCHDFFRNQWYHFLQ